MGSICPTSGAFDAKAGTAGEQLRDAIRIAQPRGIACHSLLGRTGCEIAKATAASRRTSGTPSRSARPCATRRWPPAQDRDREPRRRHAGLGARRARRSRGPGLRRREPRSGKRDVDDGGSGRQPRNAGLLCRLHQHPGFRDLESPKGAVVQWTAIGDGDVDFRRWDDIFADPDKGVPVFIETISGLGGPSTASSRISGSRGRRRAPRISRAGWPLRVAASHGTLRGPEGPERPPRAGATESRAREEPDLLPEQAGARNSPLVISGGDRGRLMPTSFTPKTLTFLRALDRNNDREWFKARKGRLRQADREPMCGSSSSSPARARSRRDRRLAQRRSRFRQYGTRGSARTRRRSRQTSRCSTRPRGLRRACRPGSTSNSMRRKRGSAAVCIIRTERTPGRPRAPRRKPGRLRAIVESPSFRKRLGALDGDSLTRVPRGFPRITPPRNTLRSRIWWRCGPFPVRSPPSRPLDALVACSALAPIIRFLNEPDCGAD